jgi:hypothetical protein
MVKHIVMIRFKEEYKSKVVEMKLEIEDLLHTVPSLKEMEVGINFNDRPSGYDLVLTAGFDEIEGLNSYRIHPDHMTVLEKLKEFANEWAAVDYLL